MNRFALVLAGVLVLGGAAAQPAPSPATTFQFHISERAPSRALQALADTTGLRIVYGSADLFGVSMNPVEGQMDYHSALNRMLSGTGLSWRVDELRGEVVIAPRAPALRRR